MVGQPFTDDLKRAEAIRFVRECLLINPYIIEVTDISIGFENEVTTINCKIITVYGEVNVSV